MKKIISVIISSVVLTALGTGTMLHSKADMKIEKASFSVSADRSHRPSAYCRNADGSAISHDYSSSDNFCISQYANGNATIMSYDSFPAYCIGNHLQNAPVSLMQATRCSDIPYDSEEYGAIFRIASAGASSGTTEYGLDETDLYYVTQCAVRTYLYGISPDSLAFYDDNGNLNEAMTNDFIRISNAANETYIPFESIIETDSSESSAVPVYTEDKCFYRYGPFYTYSEYTDFDTYTVEIRNTDSPVIISAMSDIISTESETRFESDYPFYVFIDASYEEEITLDLNAETTVTKYDPTVYLSDDQNYQNIFQIRITDSNELLSGELSLKNTDTKGDIQLNKKFIAENTEIYDLDLISQPRFSIKNEYGKYINGIQSDGKIIFDHFSEEPSEFSLTSDSVIYVSGLPAGEYTICEIKGANGYEARDAEIIINNTAELNTCEIVNESIVTTTEITTSETTASETTADTEITIILTTATYMTNIAETTTPEIITSETTSETQTLSTHPVTVKTPSNPRIPHSPKTGDSRKIYFLLVMITLSGIVIAFNKNLFIVNDK